jgi:hypothetical protein
MHSSDRAAPLPPYTYVPGGPWPHPHHLADAATNAGAAAGQQPSDASKESWQARFWYGVRLFNAGYYWEAHEVWEDLWHVEGRRGPAADVLRALIKLAAAGVKVRERRENGVRTHCHRAGELFAAVAGQGGCPSIGLDLQLWAERAREWARNPPQDPGPPDAAVSRVFAFPLEPPQTDTAAL